MTLSAAPFLKFDYNQFNRNALFKVISKFGDPKTVKVLYLSTYIPNYIRTETILQLLEDLNIETKKVLLGDSALKYPGAICSLLRHSRSYDVIFVAFRGHEILPLVKLFTRKPLVFDAFVSVYDTLCFDRKLFSPSSLIGKCLKWYDAFLCGISSLVLVDTSAHKRYFETEFQAENIDYLYVGCNERLFKPLPVVKNQDKFTVFWYGYANPVQGIDVILESAGLLENENVSFRLVGPVRKKYAALTEEMNLKNVEFVDFVAYEDLPAEINRADLCLAGHFSDRNKAARVIAGKTFQFLACGKPTILGDNPANRELFIEGDVVHFVKMNDPNDLARKILEIKNR